MRILIYLIIGSVLMSSSCAGINMRLKNQEKILKDGFSSEILKNEAGLFKAPVMATDEIDAARLEINRIRILFREYL